MERRAGTLEDIIYCHEFVYNSLIACFNPEIRENEVLKNLVLNDTYLIVMNLLIPLITSEATEAMAKRYGSKRQKYIDELLQTNPELYSQLTGSCLYEDTRKYLKGLMINIL